jgi:hypothetical protein
MTTPFCALRCVRPERAEDLGVGVHVDVSEADWRKCGSCGGGAVLSVLAPSRCARRSRGPKRFGGSAVRVEVGRSRSLPLQRPATCGRADAGSTPGTGRASRAPSSWPSAMAFSTCQAICVRQSPGSWPIGVRPEPCAARYCARESHGSSHWSMALFSGALFWPLPSLARPYWDSNAPRSTARPAIRTWPGPR